MKSRLTLVAILAAVVLPSTLSAQSLQTLNQDGLRITFVDPVFVRPSLSFSAAFAVGGSLPSVPNQVQLSFATGKRSGYDFERNRTLTLLLDQATTLPLGMMEFDPQNNMVRLFVPRETFDRIVAAKSISGQVGDAAFVLDESAHLALRALQAAMAR